MRKNFPLNNNRNNRRRGRGNRNQGGGNNSNRIDSRARGNAPQLLDKYKKLAQDAQHNGDRVQAEYYLQFADHYFRVISDNKARQDEQRVKRHQERGDSSDDDDDEDEDDGEVRQQRGRGNRNDNRRDDDGRRGNRHSPRNRDDDEDDDGEEDRDGDDDAGDEPEVEERAPRKRAARKPRNNGRGSDDNDAFDVSVLPPAIGGSGDEDEKPRRTLRSRKTPEDSEASTAG